MSQHDFNIANQGFPATRADINNAFAALASTSSGASAPSTTFANQFWYDTANNLLMFRNEADSAWITLAYLDQATNEWEIRSAVIQAVDSAGFTIKTDDGTSRVTVADDGDVTLANDLAVTGEVTMAGGSTSANFSFGDNDKAIFGAGSDLQIYHDGSNSYISDGGTGSLRLQGVDLQAESTNGDVYFTCVSDGAFSARHDGSTKLATTSTGIDVTGTAVTDGVTVGGTLDIEEVFEKVALASSTSGTINYDFLGQGVVFFSNNQTANRTINFIGDSGNTFNSILDIGQSATCSVLLAQGSTAYYLNAYQVDGSVVTPKWSGGSAPTEGNASGIDVYTFTIIKTANATFTVLASQTQFA